MVVKIFTDGGSRGNPGPAAVGISFQMGNEEVSSISEYIGEKTNNIAEYQAFLTSLNYITSNSLIVNDGAQWFLDSKLVVEQLNNRWKVKDLNIRVIWQECQEKLNSLSFPYSIQYVPREENVRADQLVNIALDNHHK